MANAKTKDDRDLMKRKRSFWLPLAILILGAAAIFALIWFLNRTDKPVVKRKTITDETIEIKFKKEGELYFLNQSDTSKKSKIDIEIAEDEAKRNQGLMFRRSMADTLGMLFIFEDSRPRNFWMKNTYIPLDIIFVNEKQEIVTIRENTVPFSEASISSDGDAKYVVEVDAGFAQNHNMKKGDRIRFIRK